LPVRTTPFRNSEKGVSWEAVAREDLCRFH